MASILDRARNESGALNLLLNLAINLAHLAITAGLFAALYYWVPQLSGFAAGLLKCSLGVMFLWAITRTLMYNVDILGEIAKGNVAAALFFLTIGLIVATSIATAQPYPAQDVCLTSQFESEGAPRTLVDFNGDEFEPTGIAHLDTALTYIGVKEITSNRSPEIDRFTRIGARLDPPIYWCAAYTSYSIRVAGADVLDERGVSRLGGVATRHITSRSVSARDVLRGVVRPKPGSLVIWRNGSNWTGHIGFFVRDDNWRARGVDWFGRCGETAEGNTSSGVGSQRNGDGSYRRTRCIEPGAYFRIVAFTEVTYPGGVRLG